MRSSKMGIDKADYQAGLSICKYWRADTVWPCSDPHGDRDVQPVPAVPYAVHPAWRIAVVGCAFSLIWSSAFVPASGDDRLRPVHPAQPALLAAGALLWLLRRWLPGDTPQQAAAPAIAWRHALIAGFADQCGVSGAGLSRPASCARPG